MQLEKNIKELEASILYWRKQDAEYEALKDEIQSVRGPPARVAKELARIRREFEPEAIGKDEVEKLLGDKESKSPEQIANLLGHRIDYVTRNLDTLANRLETVENQYAAATVVSQPDATDEEGLPITEIFEELDDDDNIVSYRLQRPGDVQPQIREVLEKAGVKNLPQLNQKPGSEPPEPPKDAASPSSAVEQTNAISKPKKGVSFSSDTKEGHEPQVSRNARRLEQIMKDVKEQEELQKQDPIMPDEESEDDAAVRREMLEYAKGEVGPIVAELTLEEGDDQSDDEFDDEAEVDDDYDDDYDDFEDEDEHGKSRSSAITPEYRQRMVELERRLGVQSRFTQDVTEAPEEPEDESSNEDISPSGEGVGRIKVNVANSPPALEGPVTSTQAAPKGSLAKAKGGKEEKKAVRFASSLDIAPDSEAVPPTKPKVDPLSDIVEHSAPMKASAPSQPKRQSRFKKQRESDDAPASRDDFSSFATANGTIPKGPLDMPTQFLNQDRPAAPTGPEGKILGETIVERETSSKAGEDDDVDDTMLHQELAEEFQKRRKHFVNKQGGFLKETESPDQSLGEDMSSRQVSRFKAARLSKR